MTIRNLTNTDTFGEWKDLTNEIIDYINNLGIQGSGGGGIDLSDDIVPTRLGLDLGNTTNYFEELHTTHLYINSFGVFVNTHIIPIDNFLYDLGAPGYQYNDIYSSFLISNSEGQFTSYYTSNSSAFTSNVNMVPANTASIELGTKDLGWNALFLDGSSLIYFDSTDGLTSAITRDDASGSMYMGNDTGTGLFVNGTQFTVSAVNTVYLDGEFFYAEARTLDLNYAGANGSGNISGIQIVEGGEYVGWVTTSEDGHSWEIVAPRTNGAIVMTPPEDGVAYFNMENFSGGVFNLDQGLSQDSEVQFKDLTLSGNLTVLGLSNVDTLDVRGAVQLDDTINVDGAATFTKNFTHTGGSFSTSGTSTLSGTATLSGPTTTISSATTTFSGATINFNSGGQVNFKASGNKDVNFNSNVSFAQDKAFTGDIIIGGIGVGEDATLNVYGDTAFTGNVSVNGFLTLTQPLTIPPAEDGTPTIFEGPVEFHRGIVQANSYIANLAQLEVWDDSFEHQIKGTVNVDTLLVENKVTTKDDLTIGGRLTGVTSISMSQGISGATSISMNGKLSGATDISMSGKLTGLSELTLSGDVKINTPGVIEQEEEDALNTFGGAVLIQNTVTANSTSQQMALEVVGGVKIGEDLYVNGAILGSIKPNPSSDEPAAFGDYGDGEADLDPSAAATQISPTGELSLGLPPNAGAGRPGRKKRASIKPDGAAQFTSMKAWDDDDEINGVAANSSGYLFFGKANSTYFFGNNTFLQGLVSNGSLELSSNDGNITLESTNGYITVLSDNDLELSSNNGNITLESTNGYIAFLSNTTFVEDVSLNVTTIDTATIDTATIDSATVNNISFNGKSIFNNYALFNHTLKANGSSFVIEPDAEFYRDVTITGNLTVLGTQVTINTSSLGIEDAIIAINHGAEDAGIALTQDAGIFIENAEDVGLSLALFYDKSEDRVCVAYTNSVHTDTTIEVVRYANMHAGMVHGESLMSTTTLYVGGNTTINDGTLTVNGATTISNTLTVTGTTQFTGGVDFSGTSSMSGDLDLGGTLTVQGPTILSNTLNVTKAVTLSNALSVTGATTLSNTLSVTGATTLSNTLSVTGATTLSNTVEFLGSTLFRDEITAFQFATFQRKLSVSGNTAIGGNLSVTSYANVGSLDVTGPTLLKDSLSVTGTSTFNNTMTVEHIIPSANVSYDLGTPEMRFRDLYLSGTTLTLGGASLGATEEGSLTTGGGDFTVDGSIISYGGLTVNTAADFSNTVSIDGAVTLGNTLSAINSVTFSNTLSVTGAATFSNTLTVVGEVILDTLSLSNNLDVPGDLTSNTLTTNSITLTTVDVIPTTKTNKIYAIGQELWYNGDVLLIQEMSEPTTPATASATINEVTGVLETVSVDTGGSGYNSSPVVYIIGGGATEPARVTANVSGGSVSDLTIEDAGTGYTSIPDVILVGGGSEPVTFGEGTFNIDNLVEGSSMNIKHNIQSINNIDYDKFMSLNPVSYTKNSNDKKEVGLIAEEVFNVYPELVGFDRKGNISGLQYTRFIPYMIKVIQEQQKTIDVLKTKIEIKQ